MRTMKTRKNIDKYCKFEIFIIKFRHYDKCIIFIIKVSMDKTHLAF